MIFANEKTPLSELASFKSIDLLIINTSVNNNQFDIIENISTHIPIKSTLIIPPQNSNDILVEDITSLNLALQHAGSNAAPVSINDPVIASPASRICTPNDEERRDLHLSGFMFGSFRVLVNGLCIDEWHGKKARSILAYLLYNRRFANSREIIMDKFWPDVAPQAARNSLNGIIHKIRRMFNCLDPHHDYILYKEDRYLLNPSLTLNLDYESFLSSFTTAQRLEREQGLHKASLYYEEATRLYKGDFMQDHLYDEWTYSERESFKQKYLHAMDRLSQHYITQEKYLLAQQYCRKMLEKDNCLETIHRRLMICLYKNGYRDLAVKQFYRCAANLEKGLDIRPGQETLDLLDNIKMDTL